MSTARDRYEEVGKKIKREADAATAAAAAAADRMCRRLALAGAINTITPCAACKLLRRRCAQECPFSPYFSPHEPQKFASVHKVFGASNVSKMLTEVPEPQRADTANSLVYEANLRLRDPVYGCMGAVSALQQQVQSLEAELQAVRAEILKHKYRQLASANILAAAQNTLIALPPPPLLPGEVSLAAASPPVPRSVPLHPLPVASIADAISSSKIYSPPSSTSTSYNSIKVNHNVVYYG